MTLQDRERVTFRAEEDLRRAVRLVSALIRVTKYTNKHKEDGWDEDLMLALEHAQQLAAAAAVRWDEALELESEARRPAKPLPPF